MTSASNSTQLKSDRHPDPQRVWDIIAQVQVCMLVTQFSAGLRARPVEARLRGDGQIYFLTDADSDKRSEIATSPDVALVFTDPKQKIYLSISGRASIINDEDIARAIWQLTDRVWWKAGPAEAKVRVLRVEPHTAELWDGPSSTAVEVFEFAKALVTGLEPNLGQNRKVTIEM
jgi:general stress protein 26